MTTKTPENFLEHPRVKEFMSASPLIDSDANENSMMVFRRIIECSMTQGRWAGMMAKES